LTSSIHSTRACTKARINRSWVPHSLEARNSVSWGLVAEALPFAFKALGGIATAYSISRVADAFSNSGAQTALASTLSPSQSTTDAIHAAELKAQQTQTLAGTDSSQNGINSGLPDIGGNAGKILAALAAAGLGAGVLGGVALGRRTAGRRRRTRGRRRKSKSRGRGRTTRRRRF